MAKINGKWQRMFISDDVASVRGITSVGAPSVTKISPLLRLLTDVRRTCVQTFPLDNPLDLLLKGFTMASLIIGIVLHYTLLIGSELSRSLGKLHNIHFV